MQVCKSNKLSRFFKKRIIWQSYEHEDCGKLSLFDESKDPALALDGWGGIVIVVIKRVRQGFTFNNAQFSFFSEFGSNKKDYITFVFRLPVLLLEKQKNFGKIIADRAKFYKTKRLDFFIFIAKLWLFLRCRLINWMLRMDA